ncbi:thiamine pyrophosphate-dependent dehydrogenase E1 component subunit alpha [Actinomyces polynesiensis]|uniref:thiamine pyrophosphate-dependent dehydrogenase E1 component subunit alpha n=1 Tax=Actinomyces polynesiensis TaxID=1325934 RepID=UPI000694E6A0|nr:thiamine pyrophosphate-dependent dehydrogenase E1 component subunit alpha [Actinomyces polynesiensis]
MSTTTKRRSTRKSGAAAFPVEELKDAYRRMSEIRAFEDRLHLENMTGDIPGFIHLYAGEEAIAVGVCDNLRPTDIIASTHRGHGHCLAKGCGIRPMMCEIFGRDEGLCRGKGGSMHIADLSVGMLGANGIVGGGPPLIIGAGLSAKVLGNGGVGVSFTGDGGSNQGLTFEALNMAVVLQLPVVFVFENNGMGEATGAAFAVGSGDVAGRAAGFGLPATVVDGTDYFAVREAAAEAVQRAREGGGPSVIEASAIRFYGHFEGDAGLYRTPEQLQTYKDERDPLKIFRENTEGVIDPSELDAIDEAATTEVDEAVAYARAAEWPAPSQVLTDVYKTY